MIGFNPSFPVKLASWPVPGLGASSFAALSAGGTPYAVSRTVLSAAGSPYVVPQAVLSADGTSYNAI